MIEALLKLGADFDPGEAERSLDLGREGGHTRRRIVHHRDATGREIERALLARVARPPEHPALRGPLRRRPADGAPGRPARARPRARRLRARRAHAARSSASARASRCSRPAAPARSTSTRPIPTSRPATAWRWPIRAGATLANMEFVQFHPTCLLPPAGEVVPDLARRCAAKAAILRTRRGEAFMERYHPLADLAPRDIVARAIDTELKRSGDEWVLLDITHRPADFVRERFPNIYARCLEFGIDITREPIPVVPAAHYICGGVRTDLSGETDLAAALRGGRGRLHRTARRQPAGLELAARGAGVRRRRRAARRSRACASSRADEREVPAWEPGDATESDEAVVITQNWDEIRRLMWNYVGIVRSDQRLARAQRRIELLQDEITEYYWNFKLTPDLVELRNLATVAQLVIECAERAPGEPRPALQRRSPRAGRRPLPPGYAAARRARGRAVRAPPRSRGLTRAGASGLAGVDAPAHPARVGRRRARGAGRRLRCARRPRPPGPSPGARAIAARHSLETRPLLRSQGDLAMAESVLRRGLATAPDDAALHRALAGVLIELGRSAEAEPPSARADALDPPPPPPPDAPLPRSANGLLVVLVPPVAGDRVPQSWPDGVVAATLQRAPGACACPRRRSCTPIPRASPPRAAGWRASSRAPCSRCASSAPTAASLKRTAASAWPGCGSRPRSRPTRSAGAARVRALVLEPRLAGGCLAEVVARALEQALALPLVESALARSQAPARARTPWTARRRAHPVPRPRPAHRDGSSQPGAARSRAAGSRPPPPPSSAPRASIPRIPTCAPISRRRARRSRSRKQLEGRRARAGAGPELVAARARRGRRALADERRRRDELLALLAVLDEDLHVPPAETARDAAPRRGAAGHALRTEARARARRRRDRGARRLRARRQPALALFLRARRRAARAARGGHQPRRPARSLDRLPGRRAPRDLGGRARASAGPTCTSSSPTGGDPLERVELDDDGDGHPERVFALHARPAHRREPRHRWRRHASIASTASTPHGDVVLREEDLDGDGVDRRAQRLQRRPSGPPRACGAERPRPAA